MNESSNASLSIAPANIPVEVQLSVLNTVLNITSGLCLEGLATAGMFGTVVLIITILRFSKDKPSFLIMLSLAFSDLGHLSFVIFHVGPELLANGISLGEFLESLFSYSSLIFWYASLGNYVLMAMNRYYAVCNPMHLSITFSVYRCKIYCFIVWFLAILLAATPVVGLCCRKVIDLHLDEEEHDGGSEWYNILKIITITINWITVLTMAVCYVAVFLELRKSMNQVNPEAPATSYQQQQQKEKEKRMRKICYQFLIISVIFVFLTCVQAATQLGVEARALVFILKLIFTVNSAVNPAIYLLFNNTLRSQMFQTLCCKAPAQANLQQLQAQHNIGGANTSGMWNSTTPKRWGIPVTRPAGTSGRQILTPGTSPMDDVDVPGPSAPNKKQMLHVEPTQNIFY